MSQRTAPWRNACPQVVQERIETCLQTQMMCLSQIGPLGYIVKHGEKKLRGKKGELGHIGGGQREKTNHEFEKRRSLLKSNCLLSATGIHQLLQLRSLHARARALCAHPLGPVEEDAGAQR